MGQFFRIHPKNPQPHLIREAVNIIRAGGVIVYPTDSSYALGCQIGDKTAVDRIRRIRRLDDKHEMTIVCRDLSELSTYAQVDNMAYRLLKANTPGPYTFILPATREVPRRLQHEHRKTIGLRVPEHPVAQALLEMLDATLISTTLILPDMNTPLIEPAAMRDLIGHQVDLVIDGGTCGWEQTTVVDLTQDFPRVLRFGKGDPAPFL